MIPSASIELERQAHALRATGRNVISLGIGDPHFAPPSAISDALKSLPLAHSHYSDSAGIEPLRREIAKSYEGFKTNQILVTPGVKQGLYYLLHVLAVRKLCILEPAWLGYRGLASYLSIPVNPINVRQQGWLDRLAQADYDCLIICVPNNPDGNMYGNAILSRLLEISRSKSARILVDAIYEHYSYSPDSVGFLKAESAHDPRMVLLNGFSKSHAVTGYRIGYMLAQDEKLIRSCEIAQQNVATCPATLSEYSLLPFRESASEIAAYRDYYRTNRDLVAQRLKLPPEVIPGGGFYYFFKPEGCSDSRPFCTDLLTEQGVLLVPGSAYGDGFESFVRLSFCLDREALAEGLNRLIEFMHSRNR